MKKCEEAANLRDLATKLITFPSSSAFIENFYQETNFLHKCSFEKSLKFNKNIDFYFK